MRDHNFKRRVQARQNGARTRITLEHRCFDILHPMRKIALLILLASAAFAQLSQQATWAVQSPNHYAIRANIVYGTWTGYDAKLDVYQRRDTTGPQPTVMFIHGGGWVLGTK